MMDITQTRRRNALQLIHDHGISKAELSRRLDKSPQHINQLLRDRDPKNIGHKMARAIESAFDKPTGWLDRTDDDAGQLQPIDSSPAGLFQYAIASAAAYIASRKTYLAAHTQAVRAIEDDFRQRLELLGVELLPPAGRFDFMISAGLSTRSLNLKIALPGQDKFLIPHADEAPDFIVVALMTDDIRYAVLTSDEYLSAGEMMDCSKLSHSNGEYVLTIGTNVLTLNNAAMLAKLL